MRLQYNNLHEDEWVVEIDNAAFREMLEKFEGADLAEVFANRMVVIERDPRQRELDQCDMFFSHNDVCDGQQTAAELLGELEEALQFDADLESKKNTKSDKSE